MYKSLSQADVNAVLTAKMSLENFVNVSENYVKEAEAGFYNDLYEEIVTTARKLQHHGNLVEDKFSKVHKHLTEFKHETNINEKFVR